MQGALEGLGGEPSSEAEFARGFEGNQMGRTVYVGRVFGLFESFPFLRMRRRL
jgi:hypothetical protein